jgi:hypothetical protein
MRGQLAVQKSLTATSSTRMKAELDSAPEMNLQLTVLGFQTTDELQVLNMKPDSTARMAVANLALLRPA